MGFRKETLAEALSSRLMEVESGCWLWTGYKDAKGYGRLNISGTPKKAHRAVYEALVGPIAPGLQIDHLCRVRACCNPAHLEPVTLRENIRRGNSGKPNRDKTHCPQGHEYSEANTFMSRGKRYCKACLTSTYKARWNNDPAWREHRRQYLREWRAKRRAEAAA